MLEIDNYITKKELCDILEISNNYSEGTYDAIIRKVVKIFGLKRYKKRIDIESKPIYVYDKDEVIQIANNVLAFFEKHYSYNIAEEKLGMKPTKFNKVKIPEGYWLIMKTSSGCTQWKLAFRKDEIDNYLSYVHKIEKGYYISRKDVFSYLRMEEKRFNRIKCNFEEIIFNNVYYYKKEEVEEYYKKYIKNIDINLENNKYMTRTELLDFFEISSNYSKSTYNGHLSRVNKAFGLKKVDTDCNEKVLYYREQVTQVANDVLQFFKSYYPYNIAEEKVGSKTNINQFKKIEIPDGYNLIMKTTTGCKRSQVAFEKKVIDNYVDIKLEIEQCIEQGNYISRKDASFLIGIGVSTFDRLEDKPEVIKFNNLDYYKKEEIELFKVKYWSKPKNNTYKKPNREINVDDIPNGFIDKESAIKLLKSNNKDYQNIEYKISDSNLRQIVEGFKIDKIFIKGRLFYKEEDIFKAINEVDNFCENYYSLKEVLEILSLTHIKIDKFEVPNHYAKLIRYKYPNKCIGNVAVKKIDFEYYKSNRKMNLTEIIELTDEYIPGNECLDLLNVSKYNFDKIKDEQNIIELVYKNTKRRYFYKKQILEIKNKIDNFYKEYITSKQAKKLYFNNNPTIIYKYKKYLNLYEAPAFAYTKENVSQIANFNGKVLKISEVEYLKNNLNNIRREEYAKKETDRNYRGKRSYINYDLEGETYLDTFNLRLYEKWSGFSEESEYTSNKWIEFISTKIQSMKADKVVSINKINSYIHATRELDNMLKRFKVNEIYELTSNDINTYFNLINKQKQEVFYEFLGVVSKDVEYMLKIKNSKRKGFRMEHIFNHSNKPKGERKLKAYEFDIYAKLFQYAADLNLHVHKSINEITKEGKVIYVSTWLYNILHLNNAWRHGDVTRFPKLELEDVLDKYGIKDYSWFNENEISLEISRLVIAKVIQWELVICKTKADGTFYCSDELAPAFATSVLILFLYHKKNQIITPFKGENSEDILMIYTTKHNRPSEKNISDYFNDFEVKDFKFSSLRMNKTVLTLIYYLANLSGDSKALVYAQKIRGHIDANSPLDYIDIDMKAFETLTRHLFARGEFGYIPSLLVSRLMNNDEGTLTFEDMTKQILKVNGLFGELCGLYNTVGFLNNVKHERELIIETLAKKSLEECQKILTNIFTQKLTSRMDNVQCLISKEGCYKISTDEDEVSCFDCPYHIPSIYALTTLCESIMNDLSKYTTASKIKQFKLALSIDRKIVVLQEAIDKYGEEYIFNCIGIDKEKFENALEAIPLPEEFINLKYVEG